MSVFAKRLKDARLKAGLSQEKLGVAAGLEESSASARMNRYELGKRTPALSLVERLAKVLELPVAYFYAATDEEAELLDLYHQATPEARLALIQRLKNSVE